MVLRMPLEDIVVTHAEGAGCYGHNGADDVALDAALLARAADGRPVRAAVDARRRVRLGAVRRGDGLRDGGAARRRGRIVSWRHAFWSNGHTHRPGRADKPTLTAAAHLAEPFELSPAVNPPLPSGGADRNASPATTFPICWSSITM